MKIEEAQQYIKNSTEAHLSKFIRDFSIDVKEITVGKNKQPTWKYEIVFHSLIDNSSNNFTDGIEPGNAEGILERIWLALYEAAKNLGMEGAPVSKDLERVAKGFNFILPEEK